MKTRKQPVRQARRSGRLTSKSGIKQQLKQQIQLSSSCSFSLPSRMNRENMGKHTRRWKKREEEYLVQLTKDAELADMFYRWKDGFYEQAAQKMNDRWKGDASYVPLDATNVKNKIRECKRAFNKGDKQGISSGTLYTKFGSRFTSSASVGAKKEESPFDVVSAVKYLNDHGCPNVELYKFATALEEERVLLLFNLKETYAERIQLLKDILASRLETPRRDLADRPPAGASSC